jgi:hypothetical protein
MFFIHNLIQKNELFKMAVIDNFLFKKLTHHISIWILSSLEHILINKNYFRITYTVRNPQVIVNNARSA